MTPFSLDKMRLLVALRIYRGELAIFSLAVRGSSSSGEDLWALGDYCPQRTSSEG